MISNFVMIMWVIMVLIAIGLIIKGLFELAYWTGYNSEIQFLLPFLNRTTLMAFLILRLNLLFCIRNRSCHQLSLFLHSDTHILYFFFRRNTFRPLVGLNENSVYSVLGLVVSYFSLAPTPQYCSSTSIA